MKVPFSNIESIIKNTLDVEHRIVFVNYGSTSLGAVTNDFYGNYISLSCESVIKGVLSFNSFVGKGKINKAYYKLSVGEALNVDRISYLGSYVKSGDVFNLYNVDNETNYYDDSYIPSDDELIASSFASIDNPNEILFDISAVIQGLLDAGKTSLYFKIRFVPSTEDGKIILRNYPSTAFKVFFGELENTEKVLSSVSLENNQLECGSTIVDLRNNNFYYLMPELNLNDKMIQYSLKIGYSYNNNNYMLPNKLMFNFEYFINININYSILLKNYLGEEKIYYLVDVDELRKKYGILLRGFDEITDENKSEKIYFCFSDQTFIYYTESTNDRIYLYDFYGNFSQIYLKNNNDINYIGLTEIIRFTSNESLYFVYYTDYTLLAKIKNNNDETLCEVIKGGTNYVLTFPKALTEFVIYYSSVDNTVSNLKFYSLDRTSPSLNERTLRREIDFEFVNLALSSIYEKYSLKKYTFEYNDDFALTRFTEILKTQSLETTINWKNYYLDILNNTNQLTDYEGNEKVIYFDKNEIIFSKYNKDCYDINNVLLSSSYGYTKRNTPINLIYGSENTNFYTNLLVDSQFDGVLTSDYEGYTDEENFPWFNGGKINCEIVDDEYLASMLGTKALKITTATDFLFEKKTFSDVLVKKFDTSNMFKKTTYFLELWYKCGENSIGTIHIGLFNYANNPSTPTKISYDFEVINNFYTPVLMPIDLTENDSIDLLNIDYIGSGELYLKNIRLLRSNDNSFNELFYNHGSVINNLGNLTAQISEFKLNKYKYESGQVKEQYDILHDLKYVYTYDDDKRLSKIKKINGLGQIDETDVSYIDYNLAKKIKSENEDTIYNYDEYNQEKEIIKLNDSVCYKEYNELGQIIKEKVFINDVFEIFEYTYNNVNLLASIKVGESFVYIFDYDIYNRLIRTTMINLITSEEKIICESGYYKKNTYNTESPEIAGFDNSYDEINKNYINGSNNYLSKINNNLLTSVNINDTINISYSYDSFDNVKTIYTTNNRNTFISNLRNFYSYYDIDNSYYHSETRNNTNVLRLTNYLDTYGNNCRKRCEFSDIIYEYQYKNKLAYFKNTFFAYLNNYMHYENVSSDYIIGNSSCFVYSNSNHLDSTLTSYDDKLKHSTLLFGATSILSYSINEINKLKSKDIYYGVQLKDKQKEEYDSCSSYKLIFKINDSTGVILPIMSIIGDDGQINLYYSDNKLNITRVKNNITKEISSKLTLNKNKWYLLQFNFVKYEETELLNTTVLNRISLNLDCLEDEKKTRTDFDFEYDNVGITPNYVVYGNYDLNQATEEELNSYAESNDTSIYNMSVAFASFGTTYEKLEKFVKFSNNLIENFQDSSQDVKSCFSFSEIQNTDEETESQTEILQYEKTFLTDGRISDLKININNNIISTRYNYLPNNKLSFFPNCVEKYDNSKVYYGYDKAKNVTNILNLSLNNDLIDSYRYEYDACNRIIEETYEDNIYNASFKIKYTYDQFGNILTKEDVLQGEIYTYEYAESNPFLLQKVKLIKNNEDLGYVINTQYHEDYPLIVNSITINSETKNITYQDGLITQIGETKFEYNAFGQRIVKSTDNISTFYYYDNKNLICSSRDGINTFYIYDDNNQLLGLRYNNEVYLYDRDMLGNIIGFIDKTGKLMIKFNYTAFGVPIINYSIALSQEELLIAQDIVLNNVFLYKGYIYDAETNLALVSSRYYSPELGRFIQPADVSSLNPQSINGLNLYTYAVNNPISFVYNSSVSNVGTAIGSVNSAVNSGISNNKQGNLYSNSINIMGGLHALSSAFAFVDQWSGFLSGGLDGGLGYWGAKGFGIKSLVPYSDMVDKFGKGMIIAGSILSWGSSVYNNFTNPNYTTGEALGASAMDAGYYTLKGLGTYYAGVGVGKAAVGLGFAAAGLAITYLEVGFVGALAIGGGVAVVIGIAGAVAIYYLGELLDYGWSELKKALFE